MGSSGSRNEGEGEVHFGLGAAGVAEDGSDGETEGVDKQARNRSSSSWIAGVSRERVLAVFWVLDIRRYRCAFGDVLDFRMEATVSPVVWCLSEGELLRNSEVACRRLWTPVDDFLLAPIIGLLKFSRVWGFLP